MTNHIRKYFTIVLLLLYIQYHHTAHHIFNESVANASTTFGFTISLKKKLIAKSATSPKITINNYDLEASYSF